MNALDIPSQPSTCPPAASRRRCAIARLPKSARDQINNLLFDGVPYAKIIKALASEGIELNKHSLSRWHLGGYQDWLRRQDWLEQMRHRHELLTDFVRENQASKIHEATLSLLAVHILDVFHDFDPASIKRQIAENPAIFLRLLNSTARLARLGLQCEVRYQEICERQVSQEHFQSALRDAGILR